MGKLLRPLSLTLLMDLGCQNTRPRALKGTQLADTQLERALESSLRHRKHFVALNTLKSQENYLDTSSNVPQGDTSSDSFVHPDAPTMQKANRKVFYQFTRTINKLLLLSLNH